ncbi:MAG: hypothetical protein JWO62_2538 [Acidimicrobiaceae bacterium]|nr:hypothetical protein [Acidimicrobiaceae bacterium]
MRARRHGAASPVHCVGSAGTSRGWWPSWDSITDDINVPVESYSTAGQRVIPGLVWVTAGVLLVAGLAGTLKAFKGSVTMPGAALVSFPDLRPHHAHAKPRMPAPGTPPQATAVPSPAASPTGQPAAGYPQATGA